MFCGKCGTNNSNHSRFCKGCGAPMNTVPVRTANVITKSRRRDKNVGIAAVAAAAVILVLATCMLFGYIGGRSTSDVVDQLMNAIMEPNVRELFELIPEEVLTDKMEMDRLGDDMLNYLCDSADEMLREQYEKMGDYEVSHELTGESKVGDTRLRGLQTHYNDYGLEVTEARDVTFVINAENADSTDSLTLSVTVVKIGRDWYLDYSSLEDILG